MIGDRVWVYDFSSDRVRSGVVEEETTRYSHVATTWKVRFDDTGGSNYYVHHGRIRSTREAAERHRTEQIQRSIDSSLRSITHHRDHLAKMRGRLQEEPR